MTLNSVRTSRNYSYHNILHRYSISVVCNLAMGKRLNPRKTRFFCQNDARLPLSDVFSFISQKLSKCLYDEKNETEVCENVVLKMAVDLV